MLLIQLYNYVVTKSVMLEQWNCLKTKVDDDQLIRKLTKISSN